MLLFNCQAEIVMQLWICKGCIYYICIYYICIYIYIYLSIYLYIYIYINMYTYIHTSMYLYIYIYTYVHRCTHILYIHRHIDTGVWHADLPLDGSWSIAISLRALLPPCAGQDSSFCGDADDEVSGVVMIQRWISPLLSTSRSCKGSFYDLGKPHWTATNLAMSVYFMCISCTK